MTKNHRVEGFLAILFAACGLCACTSQEVNTGGTGGSGGGSGDGVACLPPAQAITDFKYVPGDGSIDTTQVRFGTYGTTLSGGEDAYGSLTSDVTGDDWHISGTISDYSGFALYLDVVNGCNKADASAYSGLSYTIWGTTGNNMITLGVSTLDDAVASSWLDSHDAGSGTAAPGRCIPTSGTNQYYHPGCADPLYPFAVTGTQGSAQTVNARWTDFAMGQPTATVTATGILAIYWNLPWATGTTPYPVDIHIDNLAFIP